ncbi:MAG: hypothetical protein ACRDXX_22240 [Stackebrandtia sp.]
MRRTNKVRLVVLLLAVAVASVFMVRTAEADTRSESDELLNTRITTDGEYVPLVSLGTLTFDAGDRKFFSARYKAANPQSFNVLQAARIRCRDTSDDTEYYSVFSTRNITADSASSVVVHWLFTPPSAGRYACTLWGHAKTSQGDGHRIDVANGSIGVDDVSYPDAEEWRHTTGGDVGVGDSAYLLRRTWTAGSGDTVGVNMDVEWTNNYGKPNNGKSATADVLLYVTQLNSEGKGCRSPHVADERFTISSDTHHDKVYLKLRDIPVSADDGCTRDFAIKALVEHVSGNPLILEGSASSHYSNGIALSY